MELLPVGAEVLVEFDSVSGNLLEFDAVFLSCVLISSLFLLGFLGFCFLLDLEDSHAELDYLVWLWFAFFLLLLDCSGDIKFYLIFFVMGVWFNFVTSQGFKDLCLDGIWVPRGEEMSACSTSSYVWLKSFLWCIGDLLLGNVSIWSTTVGLSIALLSLCCLLGFSLSLNTCLHSLISLGEFCLNLSFGWCLSLHPSMSIDLSD